MDALVPNGILGKYLWSFRPPIIVNYGLLSCGQTSFSGNDPIICFAWSRKHTINDHKKSQLEYHLQSIAATFMMNVPTSLTLTMRLYGINTAGSH